MIDVPERRALTRRRILAFAAAGAVLLSATAAYAAAVTAGSTHLGTTALAVPPLYPNSVVTANHSNRTGQLQKNDTVTIVFSRELNASTLCAGAPTQTGTLTGSGITVTVHGNAGPSGNDLLSIDSASACSDGEMAFGSLDLGSNGFVTSGTATFSNSTVALTQTSDSATVVVTLGNASGTFKRITSFVVATYTPDPSLTDTAGNAIGLSSAFTTSTQQF